MAADNTADELIIVGCSGRKLNTAAPVPALELYRGWCFPQLRARVAGSPRHRARVLVLSALHGLVTADTPLLPYDLRMTPERATELQPACTVVLDGMSRSETLLLMEHGYRQALPDGVGRLITDPVGSWHEVATVLDSWGVAVTTADGQRRVFERERTWVVSDKAFLAAAHAIGSHERLRLPTLVVGIDRGGVRLANYLGVLLGVPTRTVRARHNIDDTIGIADTGRVVVDPMDLEMGCDPQRILLVDDICGSGATMNAVTRALGSAVTCSITTAVLCRNLGAARDPDLWVWDVADWVVFPWETPPPGTRTKHLPFPERLQTRRKS